MAIKFRALIFAFFLYLCRSSALRVLRIKFQLNFGTVSRKSLAVITVFDTRISLDI